MKILAHIFFTIACCMSSSAQTSWRPLAVPTTRNLNRICFLDSLNGWIAGDSGTVIRTTDGGRHWTSQNPGIPDNIADIFMLNLSRGWALAYRYDGDTLGTFIIQTTDGGNSWQKFLYPIPLKFFLSIFFLDSVTGWMAGAAGEMVATTDGGSEWSDVTIDSASSHLPWNVFRMKFVSRQNGFAVGGKYDMMGVLWRTSNGGETWFNESLGPEPLYDVAFRDSMNGIGVGGDFEYGASVIQTTDGGANWDFRWPGLFGQGRAVTFRTPTEAWAPLGFGGDVMYSLDGGSTWNTQAFPDSLRRTLNDAQFTDARTGYMVGDSGTAFKYHPFERTLEVSQRWNLVSVPVTADDARKDILFPSATSRAFAYTPAGYAATDTLVSGVGYWLEFPSSQSIIVDGWPRSSDTITVRRGWNIVGSIAAPLAVGSIVADPPDVVASPFYGYDGGYLAADTIKPGKGYWVKAASDGALLLNGPSAGIASPRRAVRSLPKK